MYTTALIASLFAAASLAAPSVSIEERAAKYHGISLFAITTPAGTNPPTQEPVPIEINKLTQCGGASGCSVSELKFDSGVAINVDINKVECRAYKDHAGVAPGSAPFTNAQPAEISTNLGTIRSILCYVTE